MIPLPLVPKLVERKGKNKAIFEIKALYPGYGVTIGNSLRRVLFSSLSGAAITQVKIKDVAHEFSTIPGVLEDVIYILLNLKKLRFKMYTDEPQKAVLKAKGEKELKASDFKFPTQVDIVNKDAHIATLTSKDAELEMEVQIEKGVGYDPIERRKREKLEIGAIALDAIFTPIRKVACKVENVRVGRRTDFDKLILEIETDGTIIPEDALSKASGILVKHFSLLTECFKKKVSKETPRAKKAPETEIKIEDLGLSEKTCNILLKNRIKTVKGLLRKDQDALLEIKGIGTKAIKEIKRALKKRGLEIKV